MYLFTLPYPDLLCVSYKAFWDRFIIVIITGDVSLLRVSSYYSLMLIVCILFLCLAGFSFSPKGKPPTLTRKAGGHKELNYV